MSFEQEGNMAMHEIAKQEPFRLELLHYWNDYYELCKPRVVALIVFTAIVGMLLATPGMVPWQPLLFGTLGIGMAAASAAAINQIVDQRVDADMLRTSHRPLPTGHLSNTQALVFAAILGVVSMAILVLLVNPLTALLTLCSLIGYAFIYTMYLKRATPQNIVIGGAAGAAPPVLGWVAVTGQIDPNSLLLFLIIFAWTPPHFWALALDRKADYESADVPMLPVTHGDAYTRWHILFYTLILFAGSLLPFAIGMSGLLYLAGATALGGGFLYWAIVLLRNRNPKAAIETFKYSILYLALLFVLLLVDHYLVVAGIGTGFAPAVEGAETLAPVVLQSA
jgi:protoheme IX farnesyltransferase